MSLKLIRAAFCDEPDCPNGIMVQGEDGEILKAGWQEFKAAGAPTKHRCPDCSKNLGAAMSGYPVA